MIAMLVSSLIPSGITNDIIIKPFSILNNGITDNQQKIKQALKPKYDDEARKHFLTEGQILISTVPTNIVTVLGSCVAVCIWDKKQKIGGLNHYLLPGTADDNPYSFNRGISATSILIKSMLNRKCEIANLEAKVFGGCNSLNQYEVGKQNIEIAYKKLKEAGIPVVACHTGGIYGRKIIFNTYTGNVLMRLLNKSLSDLNKDIMNGLAV